MHRTILDQGRGLPNGAEKNAGSRFLEFEIHS